MPLAELNRRGEGKRDGRQNARSDHGRGWAFTDYRQRAHANRFGESTFGVIDLSESMAALREAVDKVHANDLTRIEATLAAQAATLDAIFNEMENPRPVAFVKQANIANGPQ
jgi:hypothetical protein